MDDLPVIVLRTESSTKASHWQKQLSAIRCAMILQTELAPNDPPVDIVITDSPLSKVATGIYGVIGVGAEMAADVVFAEEPTARELQLACELLYEIVQLRRAREASQQTQQLLTEMAELDGLTGLANRRAWDAELARRMKRAIQGNATLGLPTLGLPTLGLALFDLDHFKDVNTTHGYAAADKVLQQAGNALRESLRAEDFVARIGGDEFGVLLSNISAERAEAVVERIRASIELSLDRTGLVVVTATAGLALRDQSHDAEALFAAADANLRQGKSAGRNQTVAST